ncbi:hypothetical protein PUW59_05215 [Lactobacillus mulieris]|nr:hypothetical protein PUW59_05215 [Lactobacillus mulieris]
MAKKNKKVTNIYYIQINVTNESDNKNDDTLKRVTLASLIVSIANTIKNWF